MAGVKQRTYKRHEKGVKPPTGEKRKFIELKRRARRKLTYGKQFPKTATSKAFCANQTRSNPPSDVCGCLQKRSEHPLAGAESICDSEGGIETRKGWRLRPLINTLIKFSIVSNHLLTIERKPRDDNDKGRARVTCRGPIHTTRFEIQILLVYLMYAVTIV